jgi:hypothetical protein
MRDVYLTGKPMLSSEAGKIFPILLISTLLAGCSKELKNGSAERNLNPNVAAAVAEGAGSTETKSKPALSKGDTAESDTHEDSDSEGKGSEEVTEAEPQPKACQTVDDCPSDMACVVRGALTVCEIGVSGNRGPLDQPPPPNGLVDGGRMSEGAH